MAIINNNWFNLNSTRRYPVDDFATGESDEGFDLPNDIITDIRLRFPRSLGSFASISSINCTDKIVTVTIVGHDNHPSVSNVSGSMENFQPLAVISAAKPLTANTPYKLKALSSGVFGWIVFGEGVEKRFSGRFSNSDQALISPRLAYSYGSYPVTSLSTIDNSIKLIGDVSLRGIGDLRVAIEQRSIRGLGTVNALVFQLFSPSDDANLYKKYLGKCQGRPESDSCKKISVEYINNIQPDCYGNIDINFTQNGIRQKELVYTSMTGIALEMPLGLAEACTRDDYLPDQYGNLPNQYADVCADVAAAEGDPDAVAGTGNDVYAEQGISSEIATTSALPYLDTLAYAPASPPPFSFQFLKGSYVYENSNYSRQFPSGFSSNALLVKNPGSRFLAIWNDYANYDHSYSKDNDLASIGVRVSATIAFKPLSTQGAAGVVIDFTTAYVSSCDKYVNTYMMGAIDFASKRLKILYWDGFKFLTIATSGVISGIGPGDWLSLDFQKDTLDVSGSNVKYKLRMYTSENYWTDVSVASSLSSEVGSTPYPGYITSIDDNVLQSVEAYSANNDSTGLCGIGTITGSPLFSYFFVG